MTNKPITHRWLAGGLVFFFITSFSFAPARSAWAMTDQQAAPTDQTAPVVSVGQSNATPETTEAPPTETPGDDLSRFMTGEDATLESSAAPAESLPVETAPNPSPSPETGPFPVVAQPEERVTYYCGRSDIVGHSSCHVATREDYETVSYWQDQSYMGYHAIADQESLDSMTNSFVPALLAAGTSADSPHVENCFTVFEQGGCFITVGSGSGTSSETAVVPNPDQGEAVNAANDHWLSQFPTGISPADPTPITDSGNPGEAAANLALSPAELGNAIVEFFNGNPAPENTESGSPAEVTPTPSSSPSGFDVSQNTNRAVTGLPAITFSNPPTTICEASSPCYVTDVGAPQTDVVVLQSGIPMGDVQVRLQSLLPGSPHTISSVQISIVERRGTVKWKAEANDDLWAAVYTDSYYRIRIDFMGYLTPPPLSSNIDPPVNSPEFSVEYSWTNRTCEGGTASECSNPAVPAPVVSGVSGGQWGYQYDTVRGRWRNFGTPGIINSGGKTYLRIPQFANIPLPDSVQVALAEGEEGDTVPVNAEEEEATTEASIEEEPAAEVTAAEEPTPLDFSTSNLTASNSGNDEETARSRSGSDLSEPDHSLNSLLEPPAEAPAPVQPDSLVAPLSISDLLLEPGDELTAPLSGSPLLDATLNQVLTPLLGEPLNPLSSDTGEAIQALSPEAPLQPGPLTFASLSPELLRELGLAQDSFEDILMQDTATV